MDIQGCPGCKERDARIADLERRLGELEARLKINSSNSSMPPSSDPPGVKEAAANVKKKKRKKPKRPRGGQAGHPPHLKKLFPPEQVTRVVPIVPKVCDGCHEPLPHQAGPNDPQPKRHQVAELPPIIIEVTE